MRSIKRIKWDDISAREYIARVNRGRQPYGLTYLSACDYLKISLSSASFIK